MNEADFAIVVGISTYHSLPSLRSPARDARAFRDWLVDPEGGGLPADNVTLLLGEDVDVERGKVDFALRSLTERRKERRWRRLYIYMSGHCAQTTSGEIVMLLSDTSVEDMDSVVPRPYADYLRDSGAFEEVVLLVDAQRSERLQTPEYIGRLRLKLDRNASYFYGIAVASNQHVVEAVGDSHGLFSAALLDALTSNAGEIDSERLAGFIAERLRANPHHSQTPKLQFGGRPIRFRTTGRGVEHGDSKPISQSELAASLESSPIDQASLGSATEMESTATLGKPPSLPPNSNASLERTEPEPKIEPQPKPREPRPPEPKAPDAWMLDDRPLEDQFASKDRFEFRDYAAALASILDHPKTETPFTMAINAPWGAGKTTLANMIAAELEQRPKDRGQRPHIICRFNAWMNDDAPNLATAFISEITRTANRHRSKLTRIFDPVPAAVLEGPQRLARRIIVIGLLVALTLLASWEVGDHLHDVEEQKAYEAAKSMQYQVTETFDPSSKKLVSVSETTTRARAVKPSLPAPSMHPIDGVLAWFQLRMVLVGTFVTALAGLVGAVWKVPTSLAGFVQSPQKAAETGSIQAAQRRLKRLMRQATWRGNRFVVFVDDIERCNPPRSLDVLDAINQLMDHRGVLVVLLGDMSAVAAAAQLKYKDLAEIYVPGAGIAGAGDSGGKEAFGRLYLQKIIQFQFDLPVPPKSKIRDYLTSLLASQNNPGGTND